jgi:hypothetical protein
MVALKSLRGATISPKSKSRPEKNLFRGTHQIRRKTRM